MRSLKPGLLFVAAAVAAYSLAGCASVPYRDEVVVFVPVPAPCPRPHPHPHPLPSPPPPIVIETPDTQRSAPLDRDQDNAAPLTKTREIRPTTTPVRPRGEAAGDARPPIRNSGSGRDSGGAAVPGRTRAR